MLVQVTFEFSWSGSVDYKVTAARRAGDQMSEAYLVVLAGAESKAVHVAESLGDVSEFCSSLWALLVKAN